MALGFDELPEILRPGGVVLGAAFGDPQDDVGAVDRLAGELVAGLG
jgi:hypothetical protein